jgi:hypothetical protein
VTRRGLAAWLAGRCARLLPRGREEWAAGMRAEVESIDDADEALSFALGCVWAASRERITDMVVNAKTARIGMAVLLMMLAVPAALSGWRILPEHAPTATVFAALSIAFGAAALWTLRKGAAALVPVAGAMTAVSALGFATVAANGDAWRNARLFEALAIEGVVIWGLFLAAGLFAARRFSARP